MLVEGARGTFSMCGKNDDEKFKDSVIFRVGSILLSSAMDVFEFVVCLSLRGDPDISNIWNGDVCR